MNKKPVAHIIISMAFGISAIALLAGVATGENGGTAVFKIPKEEQTVTQPVKEPKGPLTLPQETSPEPEAEKKNQEMPYSYDPTNKPDPFKSFITLQEELEEQEARETPRTYLETLDLSQLTISAIILGDADHWALVRDSKGDGHVIKVGTPIGKRNGHVTAILEDKVLVREFYKDIRGREISRDHVLKLPIVE